MNPGDEVDYAVANRWIWDDSSALPDAIVTLETADALLREGAMDMAASLLDRAWGAQPTHRALQDARAALLDRLSIREHQINFRYIPAGWFRQGSEEGDEDERPRRRVELSAFWIAEEPLTWLQVAALGNLTPPPELRADTDPPEDSRDYTRVPLINPFLARILGTFSVSTEGIEPDARWADLVDVIEPWQRDAMLRSNPAAYGVLPAAGMSHAVASRIVAARSNASIEYALPSEAQWERAARGGLPDARYPWGDTEPSPRLADYDQFERLKLRSVRELVPNGYGLFATAGSCYEWCEDWYDALEYQRIASRNPSGPTEGKQRVARGGSWADPSYALRVSFRCAFDSAYDYFACPTIGMRPIRRPRALAR